MSWIQSHLFPARADRALSDPDAPLTSTSGLQSDENTPEEDSEWLLVEPNGDSNPAPKPQLQAGPPTTSTTTTTTTIQAKVEINIGRTSTTTSTQPYSEISRLPTVTRTQAQPQSQTQPSPQICTQPPASLPSTAPVPVPSSSSAQTWRQTWRQANREREKRRVLYKFVAAEDNELSVEVGEEVQLVEPEGPGGAGGWLLAENSAGEVGWVPRAYVQEGPGARADVTEGGAAMGTGRREESENGTRGGRNRYFRPDEAGRIQGAVGGLSDAMACTLKHPKGPVAEDDDDW